MVGGRRIEGRRRRRRKERTCLYILSCSSSFFNISFWTGTGMRGNSVSSYLWSLISLRSRFFVCLYRWVNPLPIPFRSPPSPWYNKIYVHWCLLCINNHFIFIFDVRLIPVPKLFRWTSQSQVKECQAAVHPVWLLLKSHINWTRNEHNKYIPHRRVEHSIYLFYCKSHCE